MSDEEASHEVPAERRSMARRAVETVAHPGTAWSAAGIAGLLAALGQLGYLPTMHHEQPAQVLSCPPCDAAVAPLAAKLGEITVEQAHFRERIVERLDDVERKLDNLTTDQVARFTWFSQDIERACRRGQAP